MYGEPEIYTFYRDCKEKHSLSYISSTPIIKEKRVVEKIKMPPINKELGI